MPSEDTAADVLRRAIINRASEDEPVDPPANAATTAVQNDEAQHSRTEQRLPNGVPTSGATMEAFRPQQQRPSMDMSVDAREVAARIPNGENRSRNLSLPREGLVRSQYALGPEVGRGGYGCIYKVTSTDGRTFAGKVTRSPEGIDAKLQKEARNLCEHRHPHILKFVDLAYHQRLARQMLVTELCECDLLDIMQRLPESISRRHALLVVHQISLALSYLHSKQLIHGDVKPENILIKSWNPFHVVLADLAGVKGQQEHSVLEGTTPFYSPDIREKLCYSGPPDDIWALGLTFQGVMKLWPLTLSKQNALIFSRVCHDSARNVACFNPGHDMMYLLLRMLDMNKHTRANTEECLMLSQQSLKRTSERKGVDIILPPGYVTPEFW